MEFQIKEHFKASQQNQLPCLLPSHPDGSPQGQLRPTFLAVSSDVYLMLIDTHFCSMLWFFPL